MGGELFAAVFLFFPKVFERGGGFLEGFFIVGSLTAEADGGHFAAERTLGGRVGLVGYGKIDGVPGVDTHFSGGGDGVLVRAEEKELPTVFFCLMADAFGDVLPGVAMGCVLNIEQDDGEKCCAGGSCCSRSRRLKPLMAGSTISCMEPELSRMKAISVRCFVITPTL